MTEPKLTPTQKLKLAEAEITNLKKLIHQLQDEHQKELGQKLADTQNSNYTLGYDEGFRDATNIAAAQKADRFIGKFFKK